LEVAEWNEFATGRLLADFQRVSNLLCADLFSEIDRKIYNSELIPSHGPGATADGLMGNQKFKQREWTERLDYEFPARDYLFPTWAASDPSLSTVTFHEPGEERPVKVILVPKTQKTPRIIAIEPTCMQYMQQAVKDAIYEGVEEDYLLKTLIGFYSQVPNQDLARIGSSNGSLATLDLSEASDRVSFLLIHAMLDRFPHLMGAVDATRSRTARVPGYGVIPLSKFASMGSALCFPVEAIVFLTVVFLGIEKELNTPLTRKVVKDFLGKVRIFGDDIIVPKEYTHAVIGELEAFGFKVNASKSFWTGKFRESCGKDYYDGIDISICRVRSYFPTSQRDAKEIISTNSLRNQLYKSGFWKSVRYIDDYLGRLIPHPVVSDSSPVVGRHTYVPIDLHLDELRAHGQVKTQNGPLRWHSAHQKPLVRGMVEVSQSPINPIDDYDALLKFFLKRGDEPFADREHLRRSGRPRSVSIKTRWSSI
jgi:hypothetical protein